MRQSGSNDAAHYQKNHRKNRIRKTTVMVLSSIVVFCTTYALILPAITMSRETICGIEEHIHTEECYQEQETVPQTVLVCSPEHVRLHTHTETCYDDSGRSICGYADFVLHTHDEGCYDNSGILVCGLPEIEAHTHDESCYAPPHSHDASCYSPQKGALICTTPEGETHAHTDACFASQQTLVCSLEEIPAHHHTTDCYIETSVLACSLEGEPDHVHDEACYTVSRELSCGKEETDGHTHSDACYQMTDVQVCCLDDETPHAHADACFAWESVLTCTQLTEEEGALPQLVCDLPEVIPHIHDETCFDDDGSCICGLLQVEEHVHDSTCFAVKQVPAEAPVLICGKEEHQHSDACYPSEDSLTEGSAVFDPSDANQLNCGRIEHTHLEACYSESGTLMCTIAEHTHTKDCFLEQGSESLEILDPGAEGSGTGESEISNPEDDVFLCGLDEHFHSNSCFNMEGALTCSLEEHIHDESCLSETRQLTDEDFARLEEVIALIDAMPSSEEIEETLIAFDESDDEDGFDAYFEEISRQVRGIYIQYEALGPELYALVSNREKLMELEWLWSATTFASTNTVNVTAVNAFSWSAGSIVVRNSNGATIANCNIGHSQFKFWYAVQVEYENGRYVVKQILTDDGTDKGNFWVPGNGFVLLFHTVNLGSSVNVNVGDTAIPYNDFWKTDHPYNNGQVYGTVTFSSVSAQKNYKENKLHVVGAASTRDFIELNLYDYGSGSTGKNINDKFNEDKKMPGFQQSSGTRNIASLDAFKSTSYMNFGDIITDDLADGRLVTLNDLNPQGINVVQDTANSPISRYSNVMYSELKDGYPALADGTSLGYLFGAESYSKKMNTQSVDGLFQYNETTGAYTFNSRENFAQFNSKDNTFTLYDEIFTPNFIMYPFGNFMPFNDIVHDSKKVSDINEAYFNELYLQANYLYQQGKGEQYAQLAKVLNQFMDYAQQDNWGRDWTAKRALEHYFWWGCKEDGSGDLPPFNAARIPLERLYSLDYDVESDFYFGMEMKMNFMQPKGGLTGKDGQQPMVFYFTGDDDVWVYIDGKLFLDLSGIHRHVGGEIDFVNGEVKYYSLDTKTGDVSTTPYKTVKFSELVDTSLLNAQGTFKDYSSHSFNFYYMERGSGSSVCRMNFNFPLLRKNSISVTKELSVDEADKLDLLGNPDFRFQVLKENGTELFIGDNVAYDIMDTAGKKIGSGTTDTNGVFKLKANQTAVFSGINENSGKYFVRELLDPNAFNQYGTIKVDGSSQTINYDVTVGSDTFKGVNSPVKDVSDGSTSFHFDNQVTFNKLGSLSITKTLTEYPKSRAVLRFEFEVKLDEMPLLEGTKYTVGTETRTVTQAGIITLSPGETAVIPNILAGSTFTVREMEASSNGYVVTYQLDGETQSGDGVSGVIQTGHMASVSVNNSEQGTGVVIPVQKTLHLPDGLEHNYILRLEQITSQTDPTLVEPEFIQKLPIKITADPVTDQFEIGYAKNDLSSLPQTFFYKITEEENPEELSTQFDSSVYVVKVTVQEQEGAFSANVTAVWKDDKPLVTEEGTVPTISFINEIIRYELPSTGGGGTEWYTAGGLCLMAAAGLLYAGTRLRRKGGRDSP